MDEEYKQRIQIAVVAFNFAVIAMMILLFFLGAFGTDAYMGVIVKRVVVSILVGAVAGAAAYFAAPSMMR